MPESSDPDLRDALREAVARAPLASRHTLSLWVMQAYHLGDDDLLRLYGDHLPGRSPALISLATSFVRSLGGGRRPDSPSVEALAIAADALGWTEEAMAAGDIDPGEAEIGALAVEYAEQRELFRDIVLGRGVTDAAQIRALIEQMQGCPSVVSDGCL